MMQNAYRTIAPPTERAGGLRRAPRALLRHALRNGEISAAFQPKIALRTGVLMGVEALARWDSLSLGPVSPDTFIPMAEQEGLIAEVTALILDQALQACVELRRHAPWVTMAVNFAPSLLSDACLPARLDLALRHAGLPPTALVAEITESQAIADTAGAASTLSALRARGIGCAIDDFGTGHSSLLSLLRLPFSELKIDRAFVTHCATDRDAEMIVRATLGLAREMDLHVVAEGIETPAAETMLVALGCATGQGFRYGRAVLPAAIIARLQSGTTSGFNA
jgi:EAL domain-containing protein (putative c-di-GMP-specific phosphodiesterase class I)